MDPIDVESWNSLVEEVRDAMHQYLDTAFESVKRTVPVTRQQQQQQQQQQANCYERPITGWASLLQEPSIEVCELQQMSMQMNQYRTFKLLNPLALLSEGGVWDSPQVSVGGPHGYRVGIRVLMSGGGLAHGKSVTIFLRVFSGPYDAWLRWPFPARPVTFAMFRFNGKRPHVETCQIECNHTEAGPPSVDRSIVCATISHFITIEKLLDDKHFISENDGPNGEGDALMLGFALEGEETLCYNIKSSLETKVERHEHELKATSNVQHRSFCGNNYGDDPEDTLYCC